MVDRVWIRGGVSAAIQVSLPGVDVKTARLDQMAFDARLANMTIIMAGAVQLAAGSETFIGFGQTFSTIPRVLASFGGFQASPPPLASVPTFTSPGAVLTNHGSYKSMTVAKVTTSYFSLLSAINDPITPEVNASAACWALYVVYR